MQRERDRERERIENENENMVFISLVSFTHSLHLSSYLVFLKRRSKASDFYYYLFLVLLTTVEKKKTQHEVWDISSLFGSSKSSWQPVMTADTTTLQYWLNWRVLLCAIWVFSPMIAASILIRKYEGLDAEQHDREETQQKRAGTLYTDESWRPCLKEIHPIWLLAFRIVAFLVLLTLLIINVVLDGGGVFYFYTQWTFALVTIYFGLGSLLSLYGCYQFLNKVGGDMVEQLRLDEERGTYVAPIHEGNANVFRPAKSPSHHEEHYVRKISGIWGYAFQIIYQTSAGAATLTDVVFWLIIYPFLTAKDYRLNFLLAGMHSLNAVFLLGDTALNSLRFPWFRISYFVLWTAIFVIFQWVIHACVSLWWPYPFLDLSSPYAPVWYLMVALLHVPCYAAFPLIIKLKHNLLSRWFPHTSS